MTGSRFWRLLLPKEEEDVNQQLVLKLNTKKIPSLAQIKQLPKFLSRGEKIRLWAALLIFLVSSLTLGWKIYLQNSKAEAAYGGSYTEGLIGSPRLINPILAVSDVDRDLVKLLFSGLMKYDASGQLVPDLASAYTIDAEQKVYTFELRSDVRWHDDTPLTADDVVFTFNSIKNSEYKSPLKTSLAGVTIQKINDQTIQFHLTSPFAPFLSILTVGIIPEHLWYSVPAFSAALSDLNTKPIGCGPYQFKSLSRDSNGSIKSYVLESYKNYHLGRAYISELNFKFYPDFETAIIALQNKNVEGLVYLPQSYKTAIDDSGLTLHQLHFPQYTAVFFNPEKLSLLSDQNFRKALNIAIDKQRILNEVLGEDGQMIYTPILPGLTGYDPNLKGPDYNIEEAKKILDNLGWTIKDNAQFRTKGEGDQVQELTIKLTTLDQPEIVKTVSIIQEAWENIGVKTELEIIAYDRIKQDIIEPRNYQALVYSEVINTNSGPYPFWHSSQNKNPGLNLSVLANKDIDTALEKIRQATTDAEKIQWLTTFQNKLLELNFAIFLYSPTYIYPTDQKLKGLDNLTFINLPSDRFNNISTWYIKTKRSLN